VAAANRDALATTLLDLGTGTGQVILALHQDFQDIIGVDTDVEMLATAETHLRPLLSAGTNLSLPYCRAEDFSPPANWTASLVTVCRAFHWMDEPALLQRLANYVPETGVVAIFGERGFWESDSRWEQAVQRVVQDFLGEQRRAGGGVFSHHDRPYSEILRESPFCDVEEVAIPVRSKWTSDSVVGYCTRHRSPLGISSGRELPNSRQPSGWH
jgi:trans-aconitate methyltransferase